MRCSTWCLIQALQNHSNPRLNLNLKTPPSVGFFLAVNFMDKEKSFSFCRPETPEGFYFSTVVRQAHHDKTKLSLQKFMYAAMLYA
jgi:hypothetical protein